MRRTLPIAVDPDQRERELREEDDREREEREERWARMERLAEHASLPSWHPAVHRLARRERQRRADDDQEGEAA
jgi:hypothetical protein